jgi:hypothetical protein
MPGDYWAVGIQARLRLEPLEARRGRDWQLIERGEGQPRATTLIAQEAHPIATHSSQPDDSTSQTSPPARARNDCQPAQSGSTRSRRGRRLIGPRSGRGVQPATREFVARRGTTRNHSQGRATPSCRTAVAPG